MVLGHRVCSELLHIFPWVYASPLHEKSGEITPKWEQGRCLPCAWGGFGDPLPGWVTSPCQPQIQGWDFPPFSPHLQKKGKFPLTLWALQGQDFSALFFPGALAGGVEAFGCFVSHPRRVPVPLSLSQLLPSSPSWGTWGMFWGNDSPPSLSVVWLRKKTI